MKNKDLHISFKSALVAFVLILITTLGSAFKAADHPIVANHEVLEHNIDGNSIAIYPNPLTEDYMFLEAGKSGIICMYDAKGLRVFKSNYEAGKNKLDISNIEKNVYTVKIISDNAMAYTTFQLERG